MRRVAPALALAIAPTCLAACSFLLSFDGIDDGTPDGAADATAADGVVSGDGAQPDQTMDGPGSDSMREASPDAGDGTVGTEVGPPSDGRADAPGADVALDSPTVDAPADASSSDASEDAAPDAGCGAAAPPAMVDVGGFCIDSTEVTVAQYTDFLAAKAGDTSGEPPGCESNNSFTPEMGWPPSGPPSQAIVGVNWCDAYMYCAWAGKRLCGAIDGGSSVPAQWNNATVSQWFKACSRNADGLHVYPYGLTYDASACNGSDYDAHGPLPSLSSCQGGYPGIFDMSGNVIEWEDSCQLSNPDAGPGPSDCCNIRGGGFGQIGDQLRCDLDLCTPRSNGGGDNGFRCCSK